VNIYVLHNYQNILVGEDGVVKIADFGISKMLENGSTQQLVDSGGTPAFMSPELCSAADAFSGQLADVWAIGGTMFMLRFGHPPFVASSILALYNKIINDPLEFPPVSLDPGLRNLLANMLEKDPKLRYNMDQVSTHPWMRFAPRPVTISPFAIENSSLKVDNPQTLRLKDTYFDEEAEAMKGPVTTVDKEDIFRSIGFGVQKNDRADMEGNTIEVGQEEEEFENIMATNWAADVFEQVDADDSDDDDDDDDDDYVSAPKQKVETKSEKDFVMDEKEEDRRSKEFKNKLISKPTHYKLMDEMTRQNDGSESDESDGEVKQVARSTSPLHRTGTLDDTAVQAEEISMDDFGKIMDTLAMQPIVNRSQMKYDAPVGSVSPETVIINPRHVNTCTGVGGVACSEQGCRKSQEDRYNLSVVVNKSSHFRMGEESDYITKMTFAAVFDGHNGDTCSQYLLDHLFTNIQSNDNFYDPKTVPLALIEASVLTDTQVPFRLTFSLRSFSFIWLLGVSSTKGNGLPRRQHRDCRRL
jgi:hypothetical protein